VHLTPEQQAIGRRNFLKAITGVPALAGLGAAAAARAPIRGGPVRLGFIGLGGQGRVLLAQTDPSAGEVRALADINPAQLARADEVLGQTNRPRATHYADWREMIQREDLEGVVIAVPLWLHADMTVACIDAGLHVLCEKMMAWDVPGCLRMMSAAQSANRVLEVAYQRRYNTMYQAAHEGIVKTGGLGDVYFARILWHRNGTWRRHGEPPSPDYSPAAWGYPSWEHLLNWRLYKRYSRGLLAELGSHQINIVNWFFGAAPDAVTATGGIARYQDREVWDHIYATFEYPGGRTAVFSSIESNAFDHYYEAFFGTKGTLIMRGEAEAYLFDEEGAQQATAIAVTAPGAGPVLEASESRAADAAGSPGAAAASASGADRLAAYRAEVTGFCSAIRTGQPLACGPEEALHSAAACLAADQAAERRARVPVGVERGTA
jgi:predicted dehydrogenase